MEISLYEGIIYGPVNSRRYGRSLGINLLPSKHKVCSLNCNYCQLGFAKSVNLTGLKMNMPDVAQIHQAVEKEFSRLACAGVDIHDITVAGNGEPTLHPKFGEISMFLKNARDRLLPNAKLSLLSNGLHLNKSQVREGLACYDTPALKFEWGFPESFARMNNLPEQLFFRIVKGIQKVTGPYWIQAMFVQGSMSNASSAEIEAWIEYLRQFHPRAVQIYSLDRPPADKSLKSLSNPRLREIAALVEKQTAHQVEVFESHSPFPSH